MGRGNFRRPEGMPMKIRLKFLMACATSGLLCMPALTQPGPIPPGSNTNCQSQPGTDSLPFAPDGEGFSPLFDGVSFKGWWESCKSSHSTEKVLGGIWLVDSGLKAIYSAQKSDGSGSLLMSNRKYDNYEVVFDLWPDFKNDAGFFNRSTPEGAAYQAGIDYINGSSVGGSYAERITDASGATWNTDPFKHGATENVITISTADSWTEITRKNQPESYGCPSTGCTAADWTRIWDINGWNQMRIKFFGGLTAGNSQVRLQTWIRSLKEPDRPWVPVLDQTKNMVLPANHIAFQIHGGADRWGGSAGNWYRNIKWQPLNNAGNRLTTRAAPGARKDIAARRVWINGASLEGVSESDYTLLVRDLNGKSMARFSGTAGRFRHGLPGSVPGVFIAEFQSPRGVIARRVSRLF